MFCIIVIAATLYNGVILLNNPSDIEFPVRGIDVSAYQGTIDWDTLANQQIQFAFIKATEGSSFVDSKFIENYTNAVKTALRVGAYHFFSYDSSGKTQAENFIAVVPKSDDMLPPVVDVEFYGNKEKYLPDKDATQTELSILLTELENHYGKRPIIYAVEKSYDLYIAGEYIEYDIWIRDVIKRPTLSDSRDWVFWQYTNLEVLDGYSGPEKYIDMNVYNGTQEDFEAYIK